MPGIQRSEQRILPQTGQKLTAKSRGSALSSTHRQALAHTHKCTDSPAHTQTKHSKYSGRHIIKTYQEREMLDSNHPDIQVYKTVALTDLAILPEFHPNIEQVHSSF